MLVGMEIDTATRENTMAIPLKKKQKQKKLGIKPPYDQTVPLLGTHSEKSKSEDTCTPVFIKTLFITARTGKLPRCPSTDEWVKV